MRTHWRPRTPPAPAIPIPLRTIGQAGILPSPGRVSSTGMVDGPAAGPAVVGGRVPATVVGTVDGGVVLPVVDDRLGTVRATVGRVVAAWGLVVATVWGEVGAVVCSVGVVTTWAAARAHTTPPPSAASVHSNTTATGRDTRRCLPLAACG